MEEERRGLEGVLNGGVTISRRELTDWRGEVCAIGNLCNLLLFISFKCLVSTVSELAPPELLQPGYRGCASTRQLCLVKLCLPFCIGVVNIIFEKQEYFEFSALCENILDI